MLSKEQYNQLVKNILEGGKERNRDYCKKIITDGEVYMSITPGFTFGGSIKINHTPTASNSTICPNIEELLKEIERLKLEDIVRDSPSSGHCSHKWKTTVGFSSIYEDCTSCGKKKEEV